MRRRKGLPLGGYQINILYSIVRAVCSRYGYGLHCLYRTHSVCNLAVSTLDYRCATSQITMFPPRLLTNVIDTRAARLAHSDTFSLQGQYSTCYRICQREREPAQDGGSTVRELQMTRQRQCNSRIHQTGTAHNPMQPSKRQQQKLARQ